LGGFSVKTRSTVLFGVFGPFLAPNDGVDLLPEAYFSHYAVKVLHSWGDYPGVRVFFTHAVDILWILATRAWVY
jgi:hypothetical protein